MAEKHVKIGPNPAQVKTTEPDHLLLVEVAVLCDHAPLLLHIGGVFKQDWDDLDLFLVSGVDLGEAGLRLEERRGQHHQQKPSLAELPAELFDKVPEAPNLSNLDATESKSRQSERSSGRDADLAIWRRCGAGARGSERRKKGQITCLCHNTASSVRVQRAAR